MGDDTTGKPNSKPLDIGQFVKDNIAILLVLAGIVGFGAFALVKSKKRK